MKPSAFLPEPPVSLDHNPPPEPNDSNTLVLSHISPFTLNNLVLSAESPLNQTPSQNHVSSLKLPMDMPRPSNNNLQIDLNNQLNMFSTSANGPVSFASFENDGLHKATLAES